MNHNDMSENDANDNITILGMSLLSNGNVLDWVNVHVHQKLTDIL